MVESTFRQSAKGDNMIDSSDDGFERVLDQIKKERQEKIDKGGLLDAYRQLTLAMSNMDIARKIIRKRFEDE